MPKWDLFEKPGFDVAGYPAMSVCAGFGDSGLPVAIQLVGKPFQEPTVFRVADAFEKATPFRPAPGDRCGVNRSLSGLSSVRKTKSRLQPFDAFKRLGKTECPAGFRLCRLRRELDRAHPGPVRFGSRSSQDAKLGQRGDPVVEPDFLRDPTVLDPEYRRAGEVHLPAGCGRQRASKKIAEHGAGVCATAFPPADDVIAFGDKIGSAPKLEVRERGTEIRHEIPHVFAAATRRVQRILKQHVRGGEFVDDLRVPRIAPEPFEPSTHECLVVLFT
jgi:hypothetical protein